MPFSAAVNGWVITAQNDYWWVIHQACCLQDECVCKYKRAWCNLLMNCWSISMRLWLNRWSLQQLTVGISQKFIFHIHHIRWTMVCNCSSKLLCDHSSCLLSRCEAINYKFMFVIVIPHKKTEARFHKYLIKQPGNCGDSNYWWTAKHCISVYVPASKKSAHQLVVLLQTLCEGIKGNK